MDMLFKYVYLVSISFWIGGISLFSFVQAPVLFKSLTRDEAGLCVRTMFPGYYRMGYICAFFAIVSLLYLKGFAVLNLAILVCMLVTSLINGLYIFPKIHSVKQELKGKKDKALATTFSKLHKSSLVLNFVVWIGGMVVLYFLSAS